MNLEHLRAQSPEGIERELWTGLLMTGFAKCTPRLTERQQTRHHRLRPNQRFRCQPRTRKSQNHRNRQKINKSVDLNLSRRSSDRLQCKAFSALQPHRFYLNDRPAHTAAREWRSSVVAFPATPVHSRAFHRTDHARTLQGKIIRH